MKAKILTTILVTAILSTNGFAANTKIDIQIDGLNYNYKTEPIIKNDEILIDMKELFTQLGVNTQWNSADKSTFANKGDITLKLFDNSDTVLLNDEKIVMPTATVKLDNTMLVPLKFVSGVFGAKVDIDTINGKVTIITVENSTGSQLNYKPYGAITMSYDEALKKVKTHNNSLKQLEKNLSNLYDSNKNIIDTQIVAVDPGENTGNITMGASSQISALMAVFSNNLSIENAAYEKTVYEASAELSLKSQLTSLKLNEYNLSLKEKQMEIAQQDLNIMRAKYDLGMVSKLEYDTAVNSYEKKANDFTTSKSSLNTDFINLATLMGNNNLLNKYLIDYNVKYKPAEKIDINSYVSRMISVDPMIKVKEQKVRQYEFEANLYSYDSVQSSKTKQNNIENANDSLNDAKTDLEKKIRTAYTEILKQEENYNSAVLDLEDAKKQMEINRIKYNEGLISYADYNKSKLNVAACEFSLQSIIYQHELKVYQFSKPYLL